MENLGDRLKQSFKTASTLTRLIYINLGVFVLIKIISVVFFLINRPDLDSTLIGYLALPAEPDVLLRRPWTILSYMFLHYDFFHILFNMLWLFWFGRIFLEYLDAKKLTAVYLMGGFFGGILFMIAYNIFPAFQNELSASVALGASAAVLAVVMAIAFYAPEYRVNLLFVGRVKIKYIAIASIVIDILSIKSGNAGGHIAHLGGALFGIIYATQISRGRDLLKGFNRLLDGLATLFKPRPKMRVKYKKNHERPENASRPETDIEYNARKAREQQEIDRILDKISRSGYGALSKEEKEKLFTSSKK